MTSRREYHWFIVEYRVINLPSLIGRCWTAMRKIVQEKMKLPYNFRSNFRDPGTSILSQVWCALGLLLATAGLKGYNPGKPLIG